MKIIKASEIENMMHPDALGMEVNQLKKLTDTGLKFDFKVVAVFEKKKGGKSKTPTGKYEIHTSIYEDGGNRRRKVVLVTQRKKARRMSLGTACEMLRELRAKNFTVVIGQEGQDGEKQ